MPRLLHSVYFRIERLLARVVQMVDNTIHRINHYPADSMVCFVNIYPLESDPVDSIIHLLNDRGQAFVFLLNQILSEESQINVKHTHSQKSNSGLLLQRGDGQKWCQIAQKSNYTKTFKHAACWEMQWFDLSNIITLPAKRMLKHWIG